MTTNKKPEAWTTNGLLKQALAGAIMLIPPALCGLAIGLAAGSEATGLLVTIGGLLTLAVLACFGGMTWTIGWPTRETLFGPKGFTVTLQLPKGRA